MVDGIWPCPDGTRRWRVIFPTHSRVVEQVHQSFMLETRIHRFRLAAAGINQPYELPGRSRAAGVVTGIRDAAWILRNEQVTVLAWRRSTGNDELVRGEAGSLVGLEHTIAKSVLFRQLEVGIEVSC